jgi:hypothetical protein
VRRAIEIEIERGRAGHRMRAHDRVRDLDQRFEWAGSPRRVAERLRGC